MVRKREILFFSIICLIIILSIFGVYAEETKSIKEYVQDDESIKKFGELSGEDKNKVWEDSKSSADGITRTALIQELAKQLSQDRLNKDIAAGQEKLLIQTWGGYVMQQLEAKGINDYKGFKVENYNQLKDLAKKAGIDMDVKLNVKIEEMNGFGSRDLSWSKNGKDIIGNGKTWIDLQKLPYGTNKITYDEKKKQFILETKDNGKIILSEGSTDDKGNLNFFNSMSQDRVLRSIMFPLDPDKPKGLDSLVLSGSKDGQIIFGKDGFEILGDNTKVKCGDIFFERKSGETSQSIIKFGDSNIVAKGVEIERMGYAKIASTKEEFIVNFAGTKIKDLTDYIGKKEEEIKSKIKEKFGVDIDTKKAKELAEGKGNIFLGNFEGVVKEASYFEPSIHYQDLQHSSAVNVGARVRFQFDESGNLINIARGVENNWVSVREHFSEDSELYKLYKESGSVTQELIASANSGKFVDYDTIKQKFYSSETLRANENEVRIDSTYTNFLSMVGENFYVGGSGKVELERSLNSLTGYDGKNFEVQSGEVKLVFNGDQLIYPTHGSQNSYDISDIEIISDGKSKDYAFKLSKASDGVHSVIQSDNLVAGRFVLLGPLGSSVDIHLDVNAADFAKVKEAVNNKWFFQGAGDKFVDSMKGANYEVKIDTYFPKTGLSYTFTEQSKADLTDLAITNLNQFATEKGLAIPPETFNSINTYIKTFVGSLEKVDNSISIGFKNNGAKDPSLVISSGTKVQEYTLTEQDAVIAKALLEGSLIAPDLSNGEVSFDIFGAPTGPWPNPLLRIWYTNIGKDTCSSSWWDDYFYWGLKSNLKK